MTGRTYEFRSVVLDEIEALTGRRPLGRRNEMTLRDVAALLADALGEPVPVLPVRGRAAREWIAAAMSRLRECEFVRDVAPDEPRSVAGPPYRPPFRPLKVHSHLRQAELDALPKRISMGWDGMGAPWREWWRRL